MYLPLSLEKLPFGGQQFLTQILQSSFSQRRSQLVKMLEPKLCGKSCRLKRWDCNRSLPWETSGAIKFLFTAQERRIVWRLCLPGVSLKTRVQWWTQCGGQCPDNLFFFRNLTERKTCSQQVRFVSVKAERPNHPSCCHARQGVVWGGGSSTTTTMMTRTWLDLQFAQDTSCRFSGQVSCLWGTWTGTPKLGLMWTPLIKTHRHRTGTLHWSPNLRTKDWLNPGSENDSWRSPSQESDHRLNEELNNWALHLMNIKKATGPSSCR